MKYKQATTGAFCSSYNNSPDNLIEFNETNKKLST